jgi:hypothetical protein
MPPFKKEYLRQDFIDGLEHFFEDPHEMVPATFFMDKRDPEEFDSKVVVGTLLSITTPEKDQSYSAKNYTGDKKVKLGPKPSAIMLVFGDFYNTPNCFCLFVERKINFQRLFGNNFRLCETVRVGDVFFIKDPEPSNAMLGESLIILRDPTAIGVLVSHREYAWPAMPMSQSTEANHQVFFSEGGKLIQLTKPQLIRWGDVAKCGNYTCDRQAHCKGCFGAAPTRKPIVMTCAIKVKETPNYGRPLQINKCHTGALGNGMCRRNNNIAHDRVCKRHTLERTQNDC